MDEQVTIYTDIDNRVYLCQNEDNSLKEHIVDSLPEIPDKPLYDSYLIYDGQFTFGYILNSNKCHGEVLKLKERLQASDYIVMKAIEGEDVSNYKDYKAKRHALREEINRIEKLIYGNNLQPIHTI